MKYFFSVLIFVCANFVIAQNSSPNLYQELQDKRMVLFQSSQDYVSVELEMIEKGFTFPALVNEEIKSNQKTLKFIAYKITAENSQEMKLKIQQGVPNIRKVEILGNFITATFDENVDKYHVATLFRMLGYNSYLKTN